MAFSAVICLLKISALNKGERVVTQREVCFLLSYSLLRAAEFALVKAVFLVGKLIKS